MEEENGFYKLEVGQKRSIILFSQRLEGSNWSLTLDTKDDYTYPYNGWTYFDTYEAAATGLNFDADELREQLFPSEEII